MNKGIYDTDSYGDTQLMLAIQEDDTATAEYLIEQMDGVNQANNAGDTALIIAIWQDNVKIVKKLLAKNADTNVMNVNGKTPLTAATALGSKEIVDALLAAGANVNYATAQGDTALILASSKGYVGIVKSLLAVGADASIKNKAGKTATDVAKTEEIKNILIESPKKDINAPIDSDGNTQLIYEVEKGDVEAVKSLLENGADVNIANKSGTTPLIFAVGRNQTEIVQLLLEKGANVNAINLGDETPFIVALENKNEPILDMLVEKGAKPGPKGNTMLVSASMTGNEYVVAKLLEAGVDANAVDEDTDTGLILSSDHGHVDIVKLLLQAGANVNGVNQYGNTAIMHAATVGNTEIVNLLLQSGADVNIVEKQGGNSALIAATYGGYVDIVKALLAAGADVNIVNDYGKGAIDYAKTKELKEILLRSSGKKWKGYSAADVAFFTRLFKDPTVYATELEETPTGQPSPSPIDVNISFCPICLSYTERQDGCAYVAHQCSSPRHEELYDKFNVNGKVEWCTACGRVTKNHKHYMLSDPDDPVPGLASSTVTNLGTMQYSDKYCVQSGGGGYKEKIKRFNRLLEHAAKLQEEVGEKSEQEAFDELVEEVWRAARARNLTDKEIETIVKTQKFKIPEGAFPESTKPPVAEKEVEYPDIMRPADEKNLTPIEHKAGDCITNLGPHDDGRTVWQFRHKQPNGMIYEHMYKENENAVGAGGGVTVTEFICGEDLEAVLRSKSIDGMCPINPDKCKAKLYPEEIKGIVSDAYYNVYRKKFNEIMRSQRGGAVQSIFRNLDNDTTMTCTVPTKGAARMRTYRKRVQRRNTRGKRVKS